MTPKQRAAEAALKYVGNDSLIGLGTGSTADYFLIALADALRTGRLKGVRGVPTSEQTERRARHLGVPTVTFAQAGQVDLTVDGADEIAPNLDLIKGMGGALLREKIVAQHSGSLIIIADVSKRVDRLGTRSPVPVEVITFGHEVQARFLSSIGCQPKLRSRPDGATFVSDNGNYIYDCHFAGGIADPRALSSQLADRAGIVESGLFLGMTKVALVADDHAVQVIQR